jgi:hypothetical protein
MAALNLTNLETAVTENETVTASAIAALGEAGNSQPAIDALTVRVQNNTASLSGAIAGSGGGVEQP